MTEPVEQAAGRRAGRKRAAVGTIAMLRTQRLRLLLLHPLAATSNTRQVRKAESGRIAITVWGAKRPTHPLARSHIRRRRPRRCHRRRRCRCRRRRRCRRVCGHHPLAATANTRGRRQVRKAESGRIATTERLVVKGWWEASDRRTATNRDTKVWHGATGDGP